MHLLIGGDDWMEKYNRDLYTKGLESYEVPHYEEGNKGLDFVFGFVAGAILGSALGIVLKPGSAQRKNKNRNQTVNVNDQSTQLREEAQRKAEALKAQARQIRDEKASATQKTENKEKVTSSELEAQRRAIRSEVDSDRLQQPTRNHDQSTKSPDKKEHKKDSVATAAATPVQQENSQSSTGKTTQNKQSVQDDTVAAQQRAIRKEVDSDRLAGQVADQNNGKAQVDDKSQKSDSQAHATAQSPNKPQPHSEAQFENGVITHDTSHKENNQKDDFKLSSEHNQAVSEEAKKTNSKVDKHTFNNK